MLAAGFGLSPLFADNLTAAPAGQKKSAASDRVNLGLIGVGHGFNENLRGALRTKDWAHCTAICDVDKARRATQVASIKKDFPNQTGQLREYDDFRKMLESKDIDAVIIAVPDHWHAYMFLETLKADKHIWVEKPVANSIAECNKLMEWQAKYKKVVTTGLWQVQVPYFKRAFEILKSGVLGDVYKVHAFLCQGTAPRAAVADESAPDTLDYNMWLGPAPTRPYNSARVRGWRTFWDYGGGQSTDWGVHWLDSAFDGLKALGLHDGKTYPKSVSSAAYKHPDSFNETPACQTALFEFDKFHVVWELQVARFYNVDQGVAWIGSQATLVCNRATMQLIPERGRGGSTIEPIDFTQNYAVSVPEHMTNWLDCIRANNIQTDSTVEKGAFASIIAHLGNVSFRTGSQVVYNPNTQRFVNNAAADAYLRPSYRSPWDNMWNQ